MRNFFKKYFASVVRGSTHSSAAQSTLDANHKTDLCQTTMRLIGKKAINSQTHEKNTKKRH